MCKLQETDSKSQGSAVIEDFNVYLSLTDNSPLIVVKCDGKRTCYTPDEFLETTEDKLLSNCAGYISGYSDRHYDDEQYQKFKKKVRDFKQKYITATSNLP